MHVLVDMYSSKKMTCSFDVKAFLGVKDLDTGHLHNCKLNVYTSRMLSIVGEQEHAHLV